jgi:hypothetical protein
MRLIYCRDSQCRHPVDGSPARSHAVAAKPPYGGPLPYRFTNATASQSPVASPARPACPAAGGKFVTNGEPLDKMWKRRILKLKRIS